MARILITGASRGIGAALADSFEARGDEVLRTSRNGGVGLTLDVTDPASVAALAESVGAGALDVLVCNAGIYPDKGEPLDGGYPPEMWDAAFRTNVTGVFATIQAFLPALRRAERARIAIISSQMGSSERAPGNSYIYRASKAAVTNLGRNLAVDLKREGIAVGIYHPGWVRTDMGGLSADLSVAASAAGLTQRIDRLDLETTGAFLTWDGRAHPF
ncbi:NAD(P)-dependent dehydrogenase, short-chain alcohol dehydrogenase family [Roseivivax lentus]|uniref:NAD(P)-dependent dehydrogenase, short-chain alcohol dehydrogenase family n=1 Tax=Roseivivax lentus TaxID=633194 RepID=A0A1N7NM58_9RHOB|nr:SDR family oxidoreductase [Roseivivax lentus]SIS99371.1 NAD(P)-dependent dehydrogenase, short-chain alcohol dehydrogenase family [Roseivivax lentus]